MESQWSREVTYDWVGNRLWDGSTTYTYDDADRLWPEIYQYYGDGSLKTKPVFQNPSHNYNYDARSLLSEFWNY